MNLRIINFFTVIFLYFIIYINNYVEMDLLLLE